jgi:hypothetical protein
LKEGATRRTLLEALDLLDLVLVAGFLDLLGEVDVRVRGVLGVKGRGDRVRAIVAEGVRIGKVFRCKSAPAYRA